MTAATTPGDRLKTTRLGARLDGGGVFPAMNLVQKLTLAMVMGMCVVATIHGVLRVRSDTEFFKTDMSRDHQLPGQLLGSAVAHTWRVEGRDAALRLIRDAVPTGGRVLITWIDGPAPAQEGLYQGRYHSYVPVFLDGARLGTLELSESFEKEAEYMRATTVRTITTTLIMVLVASGLAALLGVMFVGRPMARLMEKARRVGAGDLSGPLALVQRDEIGELAREMNAMCDRLSEAHRRLANETEARLRALEQLRHADRLATVGKLASGVAHELGTPLNVVSARAKMIASGEVEGNELVESARIIGEQSERITRIVRLLLDFARGRSPGTGSGPAALHARAPHDLAALAHRTISLLKPFADKRQVALALGPSNATTVVDLDASSIEQALTNLVVNAIHAMPRPGRVTVAIEPKRATPPADVGGGESDYARVSVTDEGTGIAPDILPHIFEPFFTTKEIGEGTGLGLSVSYGIVREHGGWIAVETTPGRGSTFSIYLPQAHPS